MGNTKFTKGDWKELNGDGCQQELIITTNERWNNNQGVICEMDVVFDGEHGVQQKANAHLIASAPDMYAMLEEILGMQKQWHGHGMETHMKLHALAKKMEPILKKARGES